MTREEEIIGFLNVLKEQAYKSHKDTAVLDVRLDSFEFVIDEAIKALEQEPILDKIRAEIEHIIDYTPDSIDYDESLYNGAYRNGLYKALDIVDKYKAESEVKV